MQNWNRLNERLEPLRQQLLTHPVYQKMTGLDEVRIFMQHHVYAVWDFMSLLKALQQRLCCVSVPWLPPANPFAVRMINEIVLAEESDIDRDGKPASHYDLYAESMKEVGADLGPIETFFGFLKAGQSVAEALTASQPPEGVSEFVSHTFKVIDSGDLPSIASAFTFGREDLLPGVFAKIIQQLSSQSNGQLETFVYYLDRHVALDGDQHGPMARQLMCQLCGDDAEAWQRAETAAIEALQARLVLWNALDKALS